MKKYIKNICLILALMIALNVVFAAQFSAEGESEPVFVDSPGYEVESENYPGLFFRIQYNYAAVNRYTGDEKEIVIPDTVNGYPVKMINTACFANNTAIESVIFPDSISMDGSKMFEGCTNLRYVKLSESLQSLGEESFMDCVSLESINIPDSIEWMGKNCFFNCSSLKDIHLPDSLLNINYSFGKCSSLEVIHIPKKVSYIESTAFTNCDSLAEFTVDEDNGSFKAVDGVLFSKDGAKLVSYPQARLGERYEVPDGVSTIGEWAFFRSYDLTSLIIPDSIKEIGNYAFQFCVYLTDISIPDKVEKIGINILDSTGWFYEQPDGIVYMNNSVYSFKGELPETVVIRDGTKRIYPYAFSRREYYYLIDNQFISVQLNAYSMKHIALPDTLESIGNEAFRVCGLEELDIPDSVTEIGDKAFYMSVNMTEVIIGDGVEMIGQDAFCTCKGIEKLTIGSRVRSVGYGAFSGLRSLTDLTLKYGVKALGDSMFKYCYNLKSVKIPSSVKKIDYDAFSKCYELRDIEFPDTQITVNRTAFTDTAWLDNQPDGIVYTGRNAYTIKGEIPDEIVLKDGTVSTTWGWTFLQLKQMEGKSVIIPEGYAYLYNESFNLNYTTCSITIPSGVVEITDTSIMDRFNKNLPTIYGYNGSEAQLFAERRGCPFIPIGDELTDDLTGIEIGVKNGESLTVANADSSVFPKRLPHDGSILAAYDIGLTKDGESVGLDYKTSIKIPCENENAKVYKITESGAVIDMKAVFHGGYLVFAADSEGVYATVETPDEAPYMIGDADCSGEIEIIDAAYIQRYCLMMQIPCENTIMQGDVNYDGEADIIDATFIQRYDSCIKTPYNIGDLM